jgi:hypothetical protein
MLDKRSDGSTGVGGLEMPDDMEDDDNRSENGPERLPF